jgi:uncharacterized protein (TIGR02145 family)
MKTTGTIENGTGLWRSPNSGANNESGFSALPGGYRDYNSDYNCIGEYALFWTSEEYYDNSLKAWYRNLFYYHAKVYRYHYNKRSGFSIRCVKD